MAKDDPLDLDRWRAQLEADMDKQKRTAEEEMRILDIDSPEYARKRIREALPIAAMTMVEICETVDLDTPVELLKLRFTAAKYLLDRGFGSTSPTTGEYSEKEESALETFSAKVVVDLPADKR